jgi:hypothetical protein
MQTNPRGQWTDHDGSNHLSRSQYNSMDRVLTIEFKNGYVYHVHGFSPEDHQAFLGAPSQGQHYHNFIKDNYKITRVK